MIKIHASRMLRQVLGIDAVCCALMGATLVGFSNSLAELLDLPAALLLEAGGMLLPIAAFLGYLASRQQTPRVLVWVVITSNLMWTLQSGALLLTDWVAPNAVGYVFVLGQATVTGMLAALEYFGLRDSPALA
jgi:hypothetical protein